MPETVEPALIDFGRGQYGTGVSSENHMAQDVYDFGALLLDIVFQWMLATERKELPKVLFEIMRKCLCETGHTMQEISEMLEIDLISREVEGSMVDYLLAQEELHLSKHTAFASERATPSGFLSSVRRSSEIWNW